MFKLHHVSFNTIYNYWGGSLIALVLLWFANYYVEFIEASIDTNNCAL
uniref:ASFV G ACD 00350 CDS n=1 Tax=African swine fever virus TaxID=10497 RepID=A0A7R8V9X1_ASF|nr:ASFV G ACD 00350 CDS [African swine fever virus]